MRPGTLKEQLALYADSEWQHYNQLNKEASYLLTQEIRLISAAANAPLSRKP